MIGWSLLAFSSWLYIGYAILIAYHNWIRGGTHFIIAATLLYTALIQLFGGSNV